MSSLWGPWEPGELERGRKELATTLSLALAAWKKLPHSQQQKMIEENVKWAREQAETRDCSVCGTPISKWGRICGRCFNRGYLP